MDKIKKLEIEKSFPATDGITKVMANTIDEIIDHLNQEEGECICTPDLPLNVAVKGCPKHDPLPPQPEKQPEVEEIFEKLKTKE